MLFPTVTFAVFFLIVLPVSWALQTRQRSWRIFILVASYVFYGWWDWRFVFLLAASTVVNHVLAVGIYRAGRPGARKSLLAAAVAFDVGLLGYFKYAGFFVTSADNLFGSSWIVNVTLPIGISFFTFMAISYVIDTYRGVLVPASFARFAVFQAFFPHLIAGPIVRASELLPQLEAPRDPHKVNTSRAFFLIVSGLFLKVVIANHLSTHIVDNVFAAPNHYSSLEVLVAVYGYAVQIFADFCGYTNIAIGVALLLGFEFPQNFNSPYAAVSLQDFWRRWHMTLSRWLRDYLYIPLGGNRKGRFLTYRNLMLTMLLGGLWHGAAWTFVVWGGIHGVGLSVERGLGWRPTAPAARWFGRILTFHVVCLGWIFFRADSFAGAGRVLERLVTGWGRPSPLVTTSVVLAITVGIAGQYIRPGALGRLLAGFERLPLVAQAACVAASLTVINTLGPQGVAPFIYFRF
ncbi:MAG TPA: MBOAT family protein [Gaiellaceae bacterium]|nr:MBOAT family protein [Gaiellaceae bacterium]